MKKRIYVTDFDMKRFNWLLSNSDKFDSLYKKHLGDLRLELMAATVVEPKDIPSDIITMHSKFRIRDLNSNVESTYTLVFPFDANPEENKISILAPLGVAVIGYGVGRVIEFSVPAGLKKIRIEEILYQPEAAGYYYI